MTRQAKHPLFSDAEFAYRVERLRGRLAEQRVDVALFDEIEAMTWVSGYGNSENRWRCVGIPLQEEPFFLIRALDVEPCRERTWISDIRSFRDWQNPMPALAAAVRDRGLDRARIGLDFNSYSMPLARFAMLREALPDADIVDIGPLVWELRLIKSEAEIALLRRASAVADEAIRRAHARCTLGSSQRQVAAEATAVFAEMGAEISHPGPITAGRGATFLHGHMEERALAPGEIVHLEVTPRVGGYSARLMRCVSIGAPAPEHVRATQVLRDLQDRQIAAMRPGVEARTIDAILRDGVVASGLRDRYENITGYTLGLYVPMGPRTSDFTRIFHPEADWQLEAGQVFHMYTSAGGVALSETVLVTETGPEVLTQLPRELLVSP